LKEAGLASSRTEAERKIKEGAVMIDGQAVTNSVLNIKVNGGLLVRVGKRVKRVRLV
jgi:tyrosyl-tRNA synthetase